VSAPHEPFDTLAELHALAVLDGEERRRFEAHLAAGCARCETSLRHTEETLAAAAMEGPPQPPPAAVRATLLRRVAASRRPGPVRWGRWAAATAAAAVAAAALSGVYTAARYEGRLGEMAREQARTREALARSERVLREQAALFRGAVDLLRDPGTRLVELRGQAAAPGAVARMVWHETAGGFLIAASLPPAPPGKAYELWTIAGAVPRPAGVFVPDAEGRVTLSVPAAPPGTPVQVFAVTLEPERGVEAPTGPVVLASK
jgi:anti-sigma-K factor RskA